MLMFQNPTVERAVRCLDAAVPQDVYALVLMAYAYSVYDVRNLKRIDCIAKLQQISIIEGKPASGIRSWEGNNRRYLSYTRALEYSTVVVVLQVACNTGHRTTAAAAAVATAARRGPRRRRRWTWR